MAGELQLRKAERNASCQSQAGFSLIESIAGIALSGTVVLAIITCVLTLLLSSSSHARTVRSGIEATDIAEQVDRMPYVPCGGAAHYSTPISALVVPGYSAQYVRVEYLVDSGADEATFTSTACTTVAADEGIQRLTVRVTATGRNDVSEELVFVKRNTTCPSGTALGATC